MGNKLKITNAELDGVRIIEPIVHEDSRGVFARVFCANELKEIFKDNVIKQVNHSFTHKKGAVRGLHFQYYPDCEIKLIKCIKGSILDFVVDIRKDSPTFLKSYSVELSENNKKMIYIPEGFAHGFQTLEDDIELLYFHSKTYSPDNEGALNVKDPLLNIKLPLDIIDISKRDSEHKYLNSNFQGIKIDEL